MIDSVEVTVKFGYDVDEAFVRQVDTLLTATMKYENDDYFVGYTFERAHNLPLSGYFVGLSEEDVEWDKDDENNIEEIESMSFDSDDIRDIFDDAVNAATRSLREARDDAFADCEVWITDNVAKAVREVQDDSEFGTMTDPDFTEEYNAAIELGLDHESALVCAKAVMIKKLRKAGVI